MKRLSLKMKLTLLYTVLMTVVVCFILGILLSLNSQEILSNTQRNLESKVSETINDIHYKNGALEFDTDILELEDGIYLSVYSSDGTFLYGKIPYDFDNSVPFTGGEIRKIEGDYETEFYLMDMVCQVQDYGVVDIRGIVSVTEAEENFIMTVRMAVIFLPALVLISALLGYFMTGRTLKSVVQITETVESIQRDGDLSRRIALGSGKDEFHHLANVFDQLLEKIESGFKREQQFTSDVAHELRTPIATMLLQCEDLLSNEELNAETRQEIEVLYQKANYLSHMVSQLLILSRADQGRAQIEREMINFSELTEMTVEEIKVASEMKHITVQAEIDPEIHLRGDETLLIRMWMNLLNNALQYGNEGGNIWVRLKKDETKIYGEVKDDGIGIAEEDLPHIWERFYQADKARTGNGNSGLGLSMVKWIVTMHGGEIKVSSKLREGSIFYFSIPINIG